MLTENLQIYRDCYELVKALSEGEDNVPRSLRYGEYGKAVSMALSALDAIYTANSDIEGRPAALRQMLFFIGGVRSRVRLFCDRRKISAKRAVFLMQLIDKVSRQAIGWRNASQGQSREAKATLAYQSHQK